LNYQLSEHDMTQTNTACVIPKAKFWLGSLLMTKSASRTLYLEDVLIALNRHRSGDWGDLCDEDRTANEDALQNGGRLFSAYEDRKNVKFWIITEADRRTTTILLPEDY
jgi:hypothetical protein